MKNKLLLPRMSNDRAQHSPEGDLRVMISGGGTGGHIFPAIAIANAVRERDAAARFLFVGAEGKMEMEKVPAAGFAIEALNKAPPTIAPGARVKAAAAG